MKSNKLNNKWLLHCLIFMLIGIATVYVIVSFSFLEPNPTKWSRTAKILVVMFLMPIILPLLAAVVGAIVDPKNENHEQ
jgi:biotin transporter BioY